MIEPDLTDKEKYPSEEKIILWALTYFESKITYQSNYINKKNFRFPNGSIPTKNDLDKIFNLKNKLGEMIRERSQ